MDITRAGSSRAKLLSESSGSSVEDSGPDEQVLEIQAVEAVDAVADRSASAASEGLDQELSLVGRRLEFVAESCNGHFIDRICCPFG